MKNFGIKYNGRCVVTLCGSTIVGSYVRMKVCLRKCLALSEDPSNYVELWYQNIDGTCILLYCWN